MKKLIIYLLLLVSSTAFGQNVTMNKTNGWLRTMLSAVAQDSVMMSYGAGTNGYIPIYNSTLKKNVYTDPGTLIPTLSVSTVSPGGYANGLNYASGVFRLGKVSATNPGVLTTGTDTIAGQKRWTGINTFANTVTALSAGDGTGAALFDINRSGSGANGYIRYKDAGAEKWRVGFQAGGNDNYEISDGFSGNIALAITRSTNALTLSSLTTGSVYSSSGTLTNTAPTSGTIGYWSRTGTTLSPATSGDDIDNSAGGGIYTGFVDVSENFAGTTVANFQNISATGMGVYIDGGGTIASGNYNTHMYSNANTDIAKFYSDGIVSSVPITATGATLSGALTGTSATMSGNSTALRYIATTTSDAILSATGGATSRMFVNFANTGGSGLFGLESSAGGALFTGAPAYGFAIGTGSTGNGVQFGTNGIIRYSIDQSTGNNTWTGGGSFGGAVTGVTASPNSNDTKFATTAYVDDRSYGGVFTPTLTNVTNVSSSSVNKDIFYQKVGNTVSFTVTINVTPTATSSTQVDFSLPVASNFTSTADAQATVSYWQSGADTCSDFTVNSDITNDRITVTFNGAAGGAATLMITGHYIIL